MHIYIYIYLKRYVIATKQLKNTAFCAQFLWTGILHFCCCHALRQQTANVSATTTTTITAMQMHAHTQTYLGTSIALFRMQMHVHIHMFVWRLTRPSPAQTLIFSLSAFNELLIAFVAIVVAIFLCFLHFFAMIIHMPFVVIVVVGFLSPPFGVHCAFHYNQEAFERANANN